ncbi:hypothetical protein SNE40_008209 [Patella caerulea]|uniref:Sushi domain-containing protein n=1 Tax=Patella caerulea TaxID=87958 RepID=A0AAN8K556_PATCE
MSSLLSTYLLYSLALLVIVNARCSSENYEPGVGEKPYFTGKVNNEHQCHKLCGYSSICSGYNYIRNEHDSDCQLLSVNSEQGQISSEQTKNGFHVKTTKPGCTPYQDLNPCDQKPCREDELCILILSSSRHICLKRDVNCGDLFLDVSLTMVDLPVPASFNSQAEYTCTEGYNYANGTGLSTCMADGFWTPVDLQCEEVDCGNITLLEGMSMVNQSYSTTYNQSVQYGCIVGYNYINGSGLSTCKSDGNWTNVDLECEIVRCGNPVDTAPDMALFYLDNTDITYGVKAIYQCDTGYNQTGTGISECQLDSSWSTIDINCELIDCGAIPEPNHAVAISTPTNTTFNTSVHYKCDDISIHMEGNTETVCQSDGQWSPLNISCFVVCRTFTTPNLAQAVNTMMPAFVGHVTTFRCKTTENAVYISGNSSIECQDNGEWTSSDLVCEVRCSSPPTTVGNFQVKNAQTAQTFILGTEVDYSCTIAGLAGISEKSTCTENGWSVPVSLLCRVTYLGSESEEDD